MLNTSIAPWPAYSEREAEAVAEVLRSNRVNYWTGEECRKFETEFAAWVGTSKAVAVANGTLALDLALVGLGIGPGDEVIVTPRSFIASASCVINAGAIPVFVDVDRESGNISAETIAAMITERTKAIIPVHLAGWPADMPAIMALAGRYGLFVIEDCAQAHGAAIAGKPVGGWGQVGAWSFCQDKIMTTGGEGGMVTTSDAAVWNRMWSFKDHGKSWNAVYERQHPPGFRWLHETIGTNWRMLEMQAAIGRIQLEYMVEWQPKRAAIAARIRAALCTQGETIRVPNPEGDVMHAYYRQYAYVRPDRLKPGWDRDRIIAEIAAQGVPALHGSCSELYLERAFDEAPSRPAQRLPVARELGETSLMFLTHPNQSEECVDRVCAAITATLAKAAA